MLPWLAHGHISPFFELAKRLTAHCSFQIYLCLTPVNLDHLKNKTLPPFIQLVDLHLPSSFHKTLPPNSHTTKNLPPHLMPTLKSAFDQTEPAFSQILNSLRPDLLIYDFLMPWAPRAAARELGIKSVVFITGGAACHSFVTHYIAHPPETQFPFRNLDIVSSGEGQKTVEFLESGDDQGSRLSNKDRYFQCLKSSSEIVLIKTFREIEGKYVDYFSKLLVKEVVTVGGLVREPEGKTGDSDIINWLDQRDHSSPPVVFVSFGTEYFLSREEMMEVAKGLERNKDLNFIWVVRFPEGAEKEKNFSLPEGFLERVEGRGLVVEGWAPQAKILQHERVSGFVSHCGWSSVLEGIVYGVRIVAMPMQLDQPWDAKLVEEIGVGKEVRRRKSDGGIDGEEMGKVIDEVLRNEEMKGRVRELSEKLQGKGDAELVAAADRLWSLIF
ncbi:unnamed protein product [Linum tenue]|uniref:Glycosyltransferase n=2 Tax=Linum tenue TaxID=586396 RepID=A0AAV0QK52_9ROSI|nr:unnamed protein product [Linum tenue]